MQLLLYASEEDLPLLGEIEHFHHLSLRHPYPFNGHPRRGGYRPLQSPADHFRIQLKAAHHFPDLCAVGEVKEFYHQYEPDKSQLVVFTQQVVDGVGCAHPRLCVKYPVIPACQHVVRCLYGPTIHLPALSYAPPISAPPFLCPTCPTKASWTPS